MDDNLAQKAISFSLQNNWPEAIKTNLLIIKGDKNDIDALNRLAHAYFEINSILKAKKISLKVLKISPYNNIAIKALEKYKRGKNLKSKRQNIDMSIFIEEPGKTKLTNLINLGAEKVYSGLSAGDEVLLSSHSHRIAVTTLEGEYIGKLTDDLSARLKKSMTSKNKYRVFIKSTSKDCVKVFIKSNDISFPRETLEPSTENFSNSDY